MRTMMHEAPPVDAEPETAPAAAEPESAPVLADGVWWTFPALPVHARLVYGPQELQQNLHGCNQPRRLLCEVTDRCVDLPMMLDAGPDDEHHRGLSLVDALTASWWVRAAPGGGKTTSFLVELDEG